MQVYDWTSVPREELNPLFARQVIHGDTVTVARIFMKKGCLVPEHSHHNEQVSMMHEGTLRFLVEGQEILLGPGQVLRIPPHIPHSAEAMDDCFATDFFAPRREDWIRGDDAYLRR